MGLYSSIVYYTILIIYYFQEFACREVHESSGDWVIYFTNYTELSTFKEILETLWADASLVCVLLFSILIIYYKSKNYTFYLSLCNLK